MSLARGEFLLRIDQRSELFPTCLAQLVASLEAYPGKRLSGSIPDLLLVAL